LARQNAAQVKQLEIMRQSLDAIEAVRHDIKNHMLSLKWLCVNNRSAEAVKHINGMLTRVSPGAVFVDSGNYVIDSMVNFNAQAASEMSIAPEINVAIPKNVCSKGVRFQKEMSIATGTSKVIDMWSSAIINRTRGVFMTDMTFGEVKVLRHSTTTPYILDGNCKVLTATGSNYKNHLKNSLFSSFFDIIILVKLILYYWRNADYDKRAEMGLFVRAYSN
ncbi:MAG: hypothetical protein FWG42_08595, partial [Clostridiales bacterium]|nr:hypothetical protein [Clostridiales bacterium]